jgi:hypothetical protein
LAYLSFFQSLRPGLSRLQGAIANGILIPFFLFLPIILSNSLFYPPPPLPSNSQRKTGCRLECDKAGKITKTIPFDKLTDCDIEEPAGASGPLCCMVNNVLTKVNVDTASSGMRVGAEGQTMNVHELQLVGLKDPHGFKSMVWRMKRTTGAGSSVAPSTVTMSRDNTQIVAALEAQNSILKEQNSLLLKIVENTSK